MFTVARPPVSVVGVRTAQRFSLGSRHYNLGLPCHLQFASKLHNWCIWQVILILLEFREIGIQVVSELLMYFQAYRMHRERLAAWLCTPQVSGYSLASRGVTGEGKGGKGEEGR